MVELVQQTVWGLPIVIDLFLGGLAGGGAALLVYYDLFVKRQNRFMFWTGVVYVLSILGAIAMLISDLLQPTKFYLVFSFVHPSWMSYGSLFITIFLIALLLYVAPYLPQFRSLEGINKPVGIVVIIFGVLVATYTGFLISATPAIPFWNNSIMPILFLTTGALSGLGLGLILVNLAEDEGIVTYMGRNSLLLILAELLMLFSLINTSLNGSMAAEYSANLLVNNFGFTGGVIVIGLILPLILLIISLRASRAGESNPNKYLYIISGILILIGGFLLRYYILWAGVYAYPWPAH